MSSPPLDAAVFDVDGVVTRTASVHLAAWRRVFDELLDGVASGVDPEMRLVIRHEPLIIKLFHTGPIGGQRPAAVEGDAPQHGLEGRVKPDDGAVPEHQLAIRGVGERAAAGGDHHAAFRQQPDERFALAGAEIRLALVAKDGRDVVALGALDARVDILDLPVEALAERAGDARLAGAHEPHEVDLVGFHARDSLRWRRASRSRSSKKLGYDTATASAPSIVVGPVAPSAAIANAMASR